MEISTQSLASAKLHLQSIFDKAYQGINDMWWQQLALRIKSNAGVEEYHWLGAVLGLKEILGEIEIRNVLRHGYTIKNKEWENTVGIKRRDIERDRLGVYAPLMDAMADEAAYQPSELVARLMVNGFTDPDYTGTAFFAEGKMAHQKATPFSNKGTEKLSVSSFRTARANLLGRLNSEGRAMRLGKDLVLAVSPSNESIAKEITEAEEIDNNSNVNRGTARTLVLPELMPLGGEQNWFLFEAGRTMKPFIVQVEKEPEANMTTDPNDSHVVKTQEFIYQIYCRHNAGYGLPEFAYGSTGANDPE